MEKRLKDYLKKIDTLLENIPEKSDAPDYQELCRHHLIQISFFQHERLIHLMVTCLFAILAFAVFITLLFQFTVNLLILFVALMILLIPYIRHYYILENGTQKLYRQYDRLYALANKGDSSLEKV